jgi:hypothetical protein
MLREGKRGTITGVGLERAAPFVQQVVLEPGDRPGHAMLKPIHTTAVAAALTIVFGTAAGIAAIGTTDWVKPSDAGLDRIQGAGTLVSEPAPLASCSIFLVVGQAADASSTDIVEVTLAEQETLDLDTPDAAGFSVVCGQGPAGAPAPALTTADDVPVAKADLAAL